MREFLAGLVVVIAIAVVAGVVLNSIGGWSSREAYSTQYARTTPAQGHLMVND